MQLSTAVALAIAGYVTLCKGEEMLVTVEQGSLRGKTATSVYKTSYTAFLGIPYAVPPLGKLRFQAPQPARNWEGVRNATEYGKDCVQPDGSGSEDCLYLNVYVPGTSEDCAQLPVMFWVYGGGFRDGSSSDKQFGPDFLISYGVILVTVNYRLWQLGFLSTGDSVVPGNAGLKDQQLALSWVGRNIASFGGDPQNITIFGESAGGISCALHLVSPMSSGLFSRAIIQSGNFVTISVHSTAAARAHSFRLGAALGFETDDSQQLLDFLQSVNATDLLVDNAITMTDEEKKNLVSVIFVPSIEPNVEGAFLAESPIQMLIDGRFSSKVPIMTGATSAEFAFLVPFIPDQIAKLNEDFAAAVGPCLHLPTAELQADAANKLKGFYFGNNTISVNDHMVNFYDDLFANDLNDAFIRKFVEVSNLTLYFYVFDYRGNITRQNPWGVSHGAELAFLFLRKDRKYNFDPESEEDKVRRSLLRLWTNFAKYGNPTPETDPVLWQPYDLTNLSYLLIQANNTLQHNWLGERMGFWRENVPLLPFPDTL